MDDPTEYKTERTLKYVGDRLASALSEGNYAGGLGRSLYDTVTKTIPAGVDDTTHLVNTATAPVLTFLKSAFTGDTTPLEPIGTVSAFAPDAFSYLEKPELKRADTRTQSPSAPRGTANTAAFAPGTVSAGTTTQSSGVTPTPSQVTQKTALMGSPKTYEFPGGSLSVIKDGGKTTITGRGLGEDTWAYTEDYRRAIENLNNIRNERMRREAIEAANDLRQRTALENAIAARTRAEEFQKAFKSAYNDARSEIESMNLSPGRKARLLSQAQASALNYALAPMQDAAAASKDNAALSMPFIQALLSQSSPEAMEKLALLKQQMADRDQKSNLLLSGITQLQTAPDEKTRSSILERLALLGAPSLYETKTSPPTKVTDMMGNTSVQPGYLASANKATGITQVEPFTAAQGPKIGDTATIRGEPVILTEKGWARKSDGKIIRPN